MQHGTRLWLYTRLRTIKQVFILRATFFCVLYKRQTWRGQFFHTKFWKFCRLIELIWKVCCVCLCKKRWREMRAKGIKTVEKKGERAYALVSFQRRNVNYVNKPWYLLKLYLIFITCLRWLFIMCINFFY